MIRPQQLEEQPFISQKPLNKFQDPTFSMGAVESCWIEINPASQQQRTIIGSVYKHPHADIDQFTQEMEGILKRLNESNYKVYILGDINIDFLKFDSHLPTEKYLDMLYSYNYLPLITKPTRITDHSKTLIDHIYTNTHVNQILSGIALVDISDHLPVFCQAEVPLQRQTIQITKRDYSKFHKQTYLNDIMSVEWEKIFASSKDLNSYSNFVLDKINEITEKHAAVKTLSQRERKLQIKPWITKGILKSIKCIKLISCLRIHTKNTNAKSFLIY